MNPMLAAGMFDSPWIVAAIVIIGAFVNWLSQLRQQKQQREEERRQSQEGTTESPQKPKGAFDVEEALRRLLGEETPPPTSAPPPIPRFPGGPPPPPPPPVWRGRVTTPVLVPPPIVTALPDVSRKISDVETQTALRFAQTREQVEHHREQTKPGHRAGTSKWSGLWRDRQSVRRAFVGSLIFGPPKGLES